MTRLQLALLISIWAASLVFLILGLRYRLKTLRLRRALQAVERAAGEPETCSVLHTKDGKCPPGYVHVPGLFTRKDGTKCDGCIRPGAPISIDILDPGEQARIVVKTSVRDGRLHRETWL